MARLTLEDALKMVLESSENEGIIEAQTHTKGAENMAVIDYSEHFKCPDKLSKFLMQDHNTRINAEAEMMTRAGKATMMCDLSKRKDKHSA